MNNIGWRLSMLMAVWMLLSARGWADSLLVSRVEADVVPSAIMQTNRYLRGENPLSEKMDHSTTMRLKYTLVPVRDSMDVESYYGLGIARFSFSSQLGRPWAVFVAQGATIANLSRRLSFNYELNLGLSFGWEPYKDNDNEGNHVLGSRCNAYIGADLFLRYRLNHHWDVSLGYGFAHFSNANLEMPNEGLNTMGLRLSAAYYPARRDFLPKGTCLKARPLEKSERWSTDIVVYGGWKRKSLALPQTFGCGGFQVSPSYKLNRAVAIGPSLDGVYDHSINLKQLNRLNEAGTLDFEQPDWTRQVAVGLQARAELQMSVLRASMGAGYYVGGFHGFYETLALKVDATRHFFLNVGYCLYNYYYSNNLMLGIGYKIGKNR